MPSSSTPPPSSNQLHRLVQVRQRLMDELSQVIVGQREVIDLILISIFSRGHCLLEGVPGLAKTLMISTLAKALDLTFNRVQFTPDMMPADITGTEIIEENRSTGTRERRFLHGPLFANVVLADEVNRTPPKTQAALLEAMQERQITVGGQRHVLPEPFFVLATQNPLEQEGTYPLPEAQQDRFMFNILIRYPQFDEELEIVRRTTSRQVAEVSPVVNGREILEAQDLVRDVPVSDHVLQYATSLVRQTRVGQPGVPDFISETVRWGAGPRAVQYLVLGAKARALLSGRTHVAIEDVTALAPPVLRHRLRVNYSAQSDGVTADDVIARLIQATPITADDLTRDARLQKIFAS